MRSIIACAIVCVAVFSAGCATTQYRPMVDSGVSRGNYEDDVADCQHLADQHPAAANAAGGAAVGAVFGALLAAAVGLRGDDVGPRRRMGAANGGINGAVYGAAEQQAIVSRCMAGRGYNVVGAKVVRAAGGSDVISA